MEARKNTNKVIEYLELLGECNSVVESLLKYLSDDDVKDWATVNGYWPGDDDFPEDDGSVLYDYLRKFMHEQQEEM